MILPPALHAGSARSSGSFMMGRPHFLELVHRGVDVAGHVETAGFPATMPIQGRMRGVADVVPLRVLFSPQRRGPL